VGEAYNLYGLGFTRGSNDQPNDGLPDEIVPEAIKNRRAVVLWQQTNNGQDRNWIAYKIISDVFDHFTFDDIPLPPSEFSFPTAENYGGSWDLIDNRLRFHDGGGGHAVTGTLLYEPDGSVALPVSDLIRLSFKSHLSSVGDESIRIVISDGTFTQEEICNECKSDLPENKVVIRLNQLFTNSHISVKFIYEDTTSLYQSYWYIDDIHIEADWPIQNSTLAVRLQEAAALSFTNGGTMDGTEEIQKGDLVIGTTSGARGRVAFSPTLSSGAWSDNNAAGVLQLNTVSGTFQTEELNVIGKGPGSLATIASYNDSTDRKVNFIKAYYGRAQSSGTLTFEGIEYGNDNRFDAVMIGKSRLTTGDPSWPPDDDDNWTATEDYFRLIEWDAINTAVTNLSFVSWQVDGETHNQAIIRSHQPELQTDLTQTELLGLYAFGDGATNVYFDDFGLQIDMPVRSPFPTPLQQ
jgi:hypothetical protein